jgi:crotonobetainyl-CoA:carnitine CoA-transferase CaiB-like acyl-CoA transferase
MAGALEGVKVLEFSQIIAGPFCGLLLSDMGADVIKFEPLEGEPWRLQAEVIPKESRTFHIYNRGKRDIAIDLNRPESEPVIDALVRQADVVIINYRPGVAQQLGIDYESLRAINPRIVYCENTAFGSRGPDADKRGYDIVVQAMSGLMASNGKVSEGRPVVGPAFADLATGTMMAFAISAALFARERSGEGQKIEATLLGTALLIQGGFFRVEALDNERIAETLARIEEARRSGASFEEQLQAHLGARAEFAGNIYYRTYKTADSYLAIGCLGPAPRRRLQEALAVHDPRYALGWSGGPEEMRAVGQALVAEVEQRFLERKTQEWIDYLTPRGIPCGPVRFVEELFDDEQVKANQMIAEMHHTLLGPMLQAAPAVQMSGTPPEVRLPPPALGEHTDTVLREAGLDAGAIARLRDEHVVG